MDAKRWRREMFISFHLVPANPYSFDRAVFTGYSSLGGFYHSARPAPRLTGAGPEAYTNKLDGLHIIDDCAHFGVSISDRCGSVAKRKGSGLGRSIRRH